MQYIRLAIMIINLITFTLGLRSSGLLYGVCWYIFLTRLDSLSVPFSCVRQCNGKAVQLPRLALESGSERMFRNVGKQRLLSIFYAHLSAHRE
jgi:hypothetical protein